MLVGTSDKGRIYSVTDDGRDTLGTSFFMQLDDRAAADAFVAGEPMNKAGVYQRVELHRWSNSFQKRAADYRRKGLQQFLCTGPKTGTPEFFREHLHAHESYFASYGDSFIFRGPIRSADGKVLARRNRLLGEWAARQMGLSEAETVSYAKDVVRADFEEAGDEDVIRKVLGDLTSAGIETNESEIRETLDHKTAEAKRQLIEAQGG